MLAVIDHEGEEVVSAALDCALRHAPRVHAHVAGGCVAHATRVQVVVIPKALRFYDIEAGRAADYDWLLEAGGKR